jgi:serine/threonine protein phosphatase PrpC
MTAYAATHIGRVRPTNEDAYYLPANGECFAAVADGMGGHQAGEIASAAAIREFIDELREKEPCEDALKEAVRRANAAIYEEGARDPLKRGMGTTLTALWYNDASIYLTHVGDSRAYLLRNRALMQLSNDHSLVSELVAMGEITPEQALIHPQRNLITRALGTNRRIEADILHLDFQPGDTWFLCTDGLTNYLRAAEIAEILMRGIPWPDKLGALIDVALDRGGRDNITTLAVLKEAAS